VAEWLDERKAPAGSMRASAGASKGSP
jgi:hypothetical protein